jgi:hypothetical protein
MEPIDNTKDLAITLQVQEWNQILDVLSDGRYRVVAPLLQKIVTQAQQGQESAVTQLRPVS